MGVSCVCVYLAPVDIYTHIFAIYIYAGYGECLKSAPFSSLSRPPHLEPPRGILLLRHEKSPHPPPPPTLPPPPSPQSPPPQPLCILLLHRKHHLIQLSGSSSSDAGFVSQAAPWVVLPDRALCLLTFCHSLLTVNKSSSSSSSSPPSSCFLLSSSPPTLRCVPP